MGGKKKKEDPAEQLLWLIVAGVVAIALIWVALQRLYAWILANPLPGTAIVIAILGLLAFAGWTGFGILKAKLGRGKEQTSTHQGKPSGGAPPTRPSVGRPFASASPPSTSPSMAPLMEATGAESSGLPRVPSPVVVKPSDVDLLLARVLDEIMAYKAPRRFSSEDLYQMGLHGALQTKFGSARIEFAGKRGRPDIEIEKVAIEIKGPTGLSQLNDLPIKANDYLRDHEHLVLVLFDVQVPQATYESKVEWMKHYPGRVHVIRK
jgi:hypothetical protein